MENVLPVQIRCPVRVNNITIALPSLNTDNTRGKQHPVDTRRKSHEGETGGRGFIVQRKPEEAPPNRTEVSGTKNLSSRLVFVSEGVGELTWRDVEMKDVTDLSLTYS